ncbi:MAG: glycosyltransferase [Candidatus Paceibacterota bacterium]|jgi:glycosyltransferase involved in cell wall biosynthesis
MNKLDICIPTYNESEIIVATLCAVLAEADKHPEVECHIIVADNASTDGTSAAAKSMGESRVSVMRISEKGKGIAVRTVALASQADYFAFIDADLSVGPDELFRLFEMVHKQGDIVVGSRLLDETKITRVWWRTLTSKIFNMCAHLIVPVGVKDTQCGLKVMNKKGCSVLAEGRETSWFFDVEFLSCARLAGLSVREVPVVWNEYRYPNRATKLQVWREGILAIVAMVRIRSRIEFRRKKISRHVGALLSALVVGILCVAPSFYFAHVAPSYAGIAMTGSDAEEHYTSRIKDVYDGYPGLGNVFLSQKSQPYLVPGLGENIVARLGKLFSMSAEAVNVAAKFVFPFIIVLLVYLLVYSLCASSSGALLASVFVVVGDAILGGPTLFIGVITGRAPITSFLLYSRPINPEVSAIFLFSALLILVLFFFKNRMPTLSSIVTLGLLAGSSLYISPYVSSFLFTVFGLSIIWFLYRRDYPRAKALVASIAVGLMTLVPFLLNLFELQQSPVFSDLSLRQGLIHTNSLVIGFWIIVLVASLFVWPRRFLSSRPFFAISIIALAILLNQQVITGVALQSAHYHWYITKPLVGMVIALFSVFLIERLFSVKIIRGMLYATCLGVIFISAVLIQRASYTAQYSQALEVQEYASVLAFLQTLPVGQSVWASRDLSLYIPIYTKQDAPNNSDAEYYLVPQKFLEDRLFFEYTLRKITPVSAFTIMQSEREDIANRLFGVYWRDQHGSYEAIPDSLLTQYANDYKKIARQSITLQLSALGVSLVVWDTQNDPSWNISRSLGTKPIFRTERFEIYQLAGGNSNGVE